MHRDSERHKLFSRRAAIVTGGMAVLLSALAARMYYLQVVEASRYRTLAEENRINLRLLPPPGDASSTASASPWPTTNRTTACF